MKGHRHEQRQHSGRHNADPEVRTPFRRKFRSLTSDLYKRCNQPNAHRQRTESQMTEYHSSQKKEDLSARNARKVAK